MTTQNENTNAARIAGLSAEIWIDENGVTQCHIHDGRGHSASLAALVGTGCLTNSNTWAERRISDGTIDALETWARARGY